MGRRGWLASAMLAVALWPGAALALDLPCRTARLIVPWAPGGETAINFELIVDAINKTDISPGLQVVTVPGQGGNKGAKVAREAAPDGCTLLALHQSAMTSYLSGRVDFTWDAFEPVALLTGTASMIGARKGVAYDDVNGLIAAARAAPNSVLAGSTLGSTSHFLFLMLEKAAGIKFKHVSYDGTRERLTALLAETIDVGEINTVSAKEYLADGALKALGIATADRDALVPDVPTLKEQGIDLEFGTDRGVVLPKGTPPETVAYYERVFLDALAQPDLRRALEAKGNTVIGQGAEAYRATLAKQFTALESAADAAGLYRR
jgi:tripartite-type tricarboxylate transporter receptor subunit TctC